MYETVSEMTGDEVKECITVVGKTKSQYTS